ncbi:MAG: mannose-1-phosphate guanylyltransferase [Chloroflexota bacterium]
METIASYAVIMAGGAGTRLWPAAREDNPKQLQSLIFEKPLIAETVERLSASYPIDRVLIVTAARYAQAIARALPDLPRNNIISEPFGRNTAAAIALAAFRLNRIDSQAVFGVFPADHVVLKPDVLLRAVAFAGRLAQRHRVVDIGVPPNQPSTGYGYIELGGEIEQSDRLTAYQVKRFIEKPDLAAAREYLAAGTFVWNSGMFVWRVDSYLAALKEFLPETYRLLSDATSRTEDHLARAYEHIPNVSVDFAIMERISDVVAIPADFGWLDIGDWAALYDMMDHDAEGNAYDGPHVAIDTKDSLLLSPRKLVASIGIENLVVVDTDDVLLVMRRDRAQDVKAILDMLRQQGKTEFL